MITKRIEYYSRAGYPALYIPTQEEQRVGQEIAEGLQSITIDGPEGPEPARKIYDWSCTRGLERVDSEEPGGDDLTDPMAMLQTFMGGSGQEQRGTVFILHDFHLYLDDPLPELIRLFKDALEHAKITEKMLILVGCRIVLPTEIEKLVTVVDFKLPTSDELAEVVLDPLAESVGANLSAEDRSRIATAGGGLTTFEFQDALALSWVETKRHHGTARFCPEIVYREKTQTIKKSGLAEIVEPDVAPGDLGGLDCLKSWMGKRAPLFTDAARDFGIQTPKGTLLVGVPGAGKSLSAKVSAKIFGGMPLMKVDMGRMFAGVVGASEQNIRQMIDLAEAISPCILWIDEIERGLSGGQSSSKTDGGTTDRMIGTLLNWMQDKTKPVFVFATANDVTSLPPQLLRKGRFDEMWFIDLPNDQEREEIWNIVIRRTGHNPEDHDLSELAAATEGWTGSEIEALWQEALIECFADDTEPHTLLVTKLTANTTPLSKSAKEKIAEMRKWAETMARPATSPIKKRAKQPVRALN